MEGPWTIAADIGCVFWAISWPQLPSVSPWDFKNFQAFSQPSLILENMLPYPPHQVALTICQKNTHFRLLPVSQHTLWQGGCWGWG